MARSFRSQLKGGEGLVAPACLFVEREADLHGHLPVIDLAILDVPAGFDDFEPAHVADGLLGAAEGIHHRFFDAVR